MTIPTDRNQTAFQTHFDWAALRDNKFLYFGNDFDASIRWSTSSSSLELTGAFTVAGDLNIAGGDLALSDTVRLEIGDNKVTYLTSSTDASGVSDSVIFAGLPTSDTGVAGALYLLAGSDVHITPYS